MSLFGFLGLLFDGFGRPRAPLNRSLIFKNADLAVVKHILQAMSTEEARIQKAKDDIDLDNDDYDDANDDEEQDNGDPVDCLRKGWLLLVAVKWRLLAAAGCSCLLMAGCCWLLLLLLAVAGCLLL